MLFSATQSPTLTFCCRPTAPLLFECHPKWRGGKPEIPVLALCKHERVRHVLALRTRLLLRGDFEIVAQPDWLRAASKNSSACMFCSVLCKREAQRGSKREAERGSFLFTAGLAAKRRSLVYSSEKSQWAGQLER